MTPTSPASARPASRAAFANLSAAISGLGTAAVFAVGAIEVLAGRMTPGGVVSTAALAGLLFGPIARLADLAYVFEQAGASVDRLGEILDLEPDVVEPGQPAPTRPEVAGPRRVRPRRLRLPRPASRSSGTSASTSSPARRSRWSARPAAARAPSSTCSCASTTQPGARSGSTASRSASWPRPTSAARWAWSSRTRSSSAPTIADNIRYGAPDATDAQVEAAARAALVHDFATALPDGYDTIVGEGGHKLSQGERQRLAIARDPLRDPALVVLDEATSSLDTAGEALIQAALANLLRGRTAFVIAHRLSTVVDADRIVVMEGGLIVQTGTHADLIADPDGLYRQLCLRQFGEPALLDAAKRTDAGPATSARPPTPRPPSTAPAT